jgi:hypothetical protein
MAQRVLQNQKSLMKTDSLQTQKSWQEHVSTAEAEIFSLIDYYRIRNHWRKLIPSGPTNPHQNTVLLQKLKSSWDKDYCRIRNQWRKLIRCRPTNTH